jgi:hypothetical protein
MRLDVKQDITKIGRPQNPTYKDMRPRKPHFFGNNLVYQTGKRKCKGQYKNNKQRSAIGYCFKSSNLFKSNIYQAHPHKNHQQV